MLSIVINDYVDFEQVAPRKKAYEWGTDVVQYDNLKTQRNALQTSPRRHWFLNWGILPALNKDGLVLFFNEVRGRANSFLFNDDNEDNGYCRYKADGATTDFAMKCTYDLDEAGEWTEARTNIKVINSVKIGGALKTLTTDYTLPNAYTVRFNTAPVKYDIGAVHTVSKYFRTSAGDFRAKFPDGKLCGVSGSTYNDGFYTVDHTTYSTYTYVYVTEAIPNSDHTGNICQGIEIDFDFYFEAAFADDRLNEIMSHPDIYDFADIEIVEIK